MNEESIASLRTTGLRLLPEKVRRGFERFLGRKTTKTHDSKDSPEPAKVSPELRSRAAAEIRAYAEDNETLFERTSRFEERAERLQSSDGTTSQSALNRAERARREIQTGLSALRKSFVSSDGEEGRLAFDAELESLHPNFAPNTDLSQES